MTTTSMPGARAEVSADVYNMLAQANGLPDRIPTPTANDSDFTVEAVRLVTDDSSRRLEDGSHAYQESLDVVNQMRGAINEGHQTEVRYAEMQQNLGMKLETAVQAQMEAERADVKESQKVRDLQSLSGKIAAARNFDLSVLERTSDPNTKNSVLQTLETHLNDLGLPTRDQHGNKLVDAIAAGVVPISILKARAQDMAKNLVPIYQEAKKNALETAEQHTSAKEKAEATRAQHEGATRIKEGITRTVDLVQDSNTELLNARESHALALAEHTTLRSEAADLGVNPNSLDATALAEGIKQLLSEVAPTNTAVFDLQSWLKTPVQTEASRLDADVLEKLTQVKPDSLVSQTVGDLLKDKTQDARAKVETLKAQITRTVKNGEAFANDLPSYVNALENMATELARSEEQIQATTEKLEEATTNANEAIVEYTQNLEQLKLGEEIIKANIAANEEKERLEREAAGNRAEIARIQMETQKKLEEAQKVFDESVNKTIWRRIFLKPLSGLFRPKA